MNETREQDIRALGELLACDGWKLLTDAIRDQWQGEKFVTRVKSAVAKVRPELADESVREVLAQRAAMETVMVWPSQLKRALEDEAAKEAAGEPVVERRA